MSSFFIILGWKIFFQVDENVSTLLDQAHDLFDLDGGCWRSLHPVQLQAGWGWCSAHWNSTQKIRWTITIWLFFAVRQVKKNTGKLRPKVDSSYYCVPTKLWERNVFSIISQFVQEVMKRSHGPSVQCLSPDLYRTFLFSLDLNLITHLNVVRLV